MPLWELAGELRALSLDYRDSKLNVFPYESKVHGEPGTTLADIEAYSSSPSYYKTWNDDDEHVKDAVHVATGCRTLVAALQGGQLRRYQAIPSINSDAPQYPFRVRAFLPHWVHIEDWGSTDLGENLYRPIPPATTLRQFLAYASPHKFWLGPSPSSVSDANGRLVPADFQLMQADLATPRAREYFRGTFAHYVPWLAEDTQLAQQVLDAWYSIVDLSEPDEFKCQCKECGGHW